MTDQNKNNLMMGLEVLLIFILASVGIGAGFGCFNYATYAKELGKPDGFFWFVGAANIATTLFFAIRGAKRLKDA
jgi:hypothetical protein